MAEYPASILGTEKDKVNCSFCFKMGACRHGDRCSRLHNKPTLSQTILMQNIHRHPETVHRRPTAHAVRHGGKYGEAEEMNVCDNLGDHLVGNVSVKFRREGDAEKAVVAWNGRCFNGPPIHAERSP
ncbi:Splicing factor U2AF 35 kDa subunit [Plecturocebus cupreus]